MIVRLLFFTLIAFSLSLKTDAKDSPINSLLEESNRNIGIDLKKSLRLSLQALSIAKNTNELTGKVYHQIGYVYEVDKNISKSVENYLLATKYYSPIQKQEVGMCYLRLAYIFKNIENYDLAIEYADKAYQIFSILQNNDLLAEIYYTLSLIYYKLNEIKMAQHFNEELIKISNIISDKDFKFLALNNKGTCFLKLEMYDSAFNTFQGMQMTNGTDYVKALSLANMGEVCVKKGDYVKGYMHLMESARLNEPSLLGAIYLNLSDDLLKLNDIIGCDSYLGLAIKNNAPEKETIVLYGNLIEALNKAGQKEKALMHQAQLDRYSREYNKKVEEINNQNYINKVEINEAIAKVEREVSQDTMSTPEKYLTVGLIALFLLFVAYAIQNMLNLIEIKNILIYMESFLR
jgi:tetratricopeptide (TPR) repeat protein